jgi:hypothetical protein
MKFSMTSLPLAIMHNPTAVALLPMNPVSDWFTDLANSMSDSLANTRVDIVKQVAKTTLPTVDELSGSWYLLGLGGTYGLASKIITLVVVVLGLFVIVTPMSNHGMKISRTLQSTVIIAFFGLMFYPLYSLGYDLSMAASHAIIDLSVGKQHSSLNDAASAMLQVLLPSDVWFKVIVSFFGLILTYMAFIVAWMNYLAVLVIGLFYIMTVALRPLGDRFESLFNAANSAILTTLTTPVVITFGLLLPLMASKVVPVVGNTGISAGIFTLIGAGISFLGPLFVARWAFQKSKQVFGKVNASVSGAIDINSMPPTNSQEVQSSTKESGFKAFASSMVAGGATAELMKSDDLSGDLKKLAIEGASAAAAATGHPEISAVLNAADTTLSKERRKHAAEDAGGTAGMPPPTGPPVEQTPPPPPESPGPTSPVTEWPDKR